MADAGPHFNRVYASLADVPVDRHEGCESLAIAEPHRRKRTQVIPAYLLLRTKAIDSARRPLTHCSHFHNKGMCVLGSSCRFIHAVTLRPTAAPSEQPSRVMPLAQFRPVSPHHAASRAELSLSHPRTITHSQGGPRTSSPAPRKSHDSSDSLNASARSALSTDELRGSGAAWCHDAYASAGFPSFRLVAASQ